MINRSSRTLRLKASLSFGQVSSTGDSLIPFILGDTFCDAIGVCIGVISFCGDSDETDKPTMTMIIRN